jgi:UDP-N-acetylglucosamine 2-epimerase (hydrolysing)
MKKILFLTGTRADFGKIKSLIQILERNAGFEVFIFVTGMHLQEKYGYTLLEIERCGFKNIHTFQNYTHETTMDLTLAKTIEGLSLFVKEINPDMIIVHGDRVETLAGAIVGSLNNILVAHVEGGEVSGTVDELIRHSTSKMSQIHFVSNDEAAGRLIQMGEIKSSIFIIGSPDIDIMFSGFLPTLGDVKKYYDINFEEYALVMFHPVTTEAHEMKKYAETFVETLRQDMHNYIVIFPNNDLGSSHILEAYQKLEGNPRFKIFPSLRFEYFLTLLKNCQFVIGNSSAGVREAPYYRVPVINIGTRQQNRVANSDIINIDYKKESIFEALKFVKTNSMQEIKNDFGYGNSAELFLTSLRDHRLWEINHQKQFSDITSGL